MCVVDRPVLCVASFLFPSPLANQITLSGSWRRGSYMCQRTTFRSQSPSAMGSGELRLSGFPCRAIAQVLSRLHRNQICGHLHACSLPTWEFPQLCTLPPFSKSTGKQAQPQRVFQFFSVWVCLPMCLVSWGLVFHCGSGKSLHGKL